MELALVFIAGLAIASASKKRKQKFASKKAKQVTPKPSSKPKTLLEQEQATDELITVILPTIKN